jgi:glycosyltransferase involved in cell wall biosynthesis
MKICHITSSHLYTDTRIFLKECRTLAEKFETHFIVPNGPTKVEDGVHIHGVEVVINSRKDRFTKAVKEVYKKALEIGADVYHFHDPELLSVGLKLKRQGKKVVYDVHEDVPRQILSKTWISKPIRTTVSSIFEMYENYAARKFDAIIGATPFITNRFQQQGLLTENINNFPLLSELYIPSTGWETKEKNVCFIGMINHVRGIQQVLEAFELTEDDITLLLGGKYSSEELRNEIESAPGWKKVNYLGFVNRKKVAEVFSQSMAGLVLFHPEPNHVNAQPNKMFEYMSAGIPVIASNFPLWKDIIEKNECGLCIDPLNPQEIKEAIEFVTSNMDEAKRMGMNARRVIEEKYNWDIEGSKLLALYNKITNV